jgi:hypothetical protein
MKDLAQEGVPVTTGNGSVCFSEPYERDGVTVITASGVHARTMSTPSRWPGLRAERSADRALGAYVVKDGDVRWRPALDLTRVLTTAEIVLGAVVVAHRLTRRPGAPKAVVSMGPGGWVSMKGGTVAVCRGSRPFSRPRPVAPTPSDAHPPLWARLISAVPLEALIR